MSTDNLQSRSSSISNSRETNTFLRENYLESHSRKIAAIIYNEWTKKIFASCEYKDGKINQNIPNEPQVTDSGLAKQHLNSGYELVWNYYQQGIVDSVAISNEIKLTIETFEKKVFEEIDKDIETSRGKRKLDRKTKDQFYINEGGFNTVPQEFDFSLYLYPEVLSEIFQEVDNRNNIKEKRTLWIKSLGTYKYIVIGNSDSRRYMQKDLAFGDEEMMKGLQERVQKLLDDPQIQQLLVNYNLKKLELESNVNITRYDQERKKIWKNVDVEGQHINGTCHKCSKDYLDSLFYKPTYGTYIGGVTVMGDVFEGIQNAMIINKSWVEYSFNKVKKEYNEETSKALLNVAEFIEKSNDHAAGTIFNSFTEELNKPQPDKSKLKSFWEGIERLLPSIATISASVAKVVTLF